MHLEAAGYLHVQGRPNTVFHTYRVLLHVLRVVFTPSFTKKDAQALREIRQQTRQ